MDDLLRIETRMLPVEIHDTWRIVTKVRQVTKNDCDCSKELTAVPETLFNDVTGEADELGHYDSRCASSRSLSEKSWL